ncbi:MAG: cytochrome c biogenesis heme-transporting ATPase CcmA [Pseudomonadota bacterium]
MSAVNLQDSSGAAFLEFSRLGIQKGQRDLISDLSFSIESGDLVHLRGPNGCGKTSLLRCAAGLAEPTSGEVLARGRPLRRQRQAFSRNLSWCGHRDGLKNDLSVAENLRAFDSLRGYAHTDCRTALVAMGVVDLEELPVRVLSAGQRRRVALARALSSPSELWLLDEPFTNLDQASIQRMKMTIEAHCKQGGVCLFASHDLRDWHFDKLRCLSLGKSQ